MTSRQALARAAHRVLLAAVLFVGLGHAAQAHEGGLGNEVMWKACEAHQVNERCAFENLHHDVYRGTCQSMSGALVCVRNQPIEYAVGAPPVSGHEHPSEATVIEGNTGHTHPTGRRWPWLVGYGVLLVCVLTAFGIQRPQKH